MSHNYSSTCRRKQDPRWKCEGCKGRPVDDHSHRHATPQEIGAAVDMYFDGLSYRRAAENVGDYFGRPTSAMTVYRWVQEHSRRASELVGDEKVQTGSEWVADELAVKVGGRQFWLFNVMDADTRFVLSAYLSPERTTKAAATALSLARERAANAPTVIKTDGLASYNQGVRTASPVHQVKHVVTEGIRAVINNNLSERL